MSNNMQLIKMNMEQMNMKPIKMKQMNIMPMTFNDMNNKDSQLMKIEEIISAKRKMLINKQKRLQFMSKQNAFLDAVREDYDKYNDYIVKQKHEQMKAFGVLNSYITDLNRSTTLTKQNMVDSKEEQRKIVNEIKSIQHNLDEIVKETKGIK
jgi:putative IMPACT (imprinted ancient) family translation regulator